MKFLISLAICTLTIQIVAAQSGSGDDHNVETDPNVDNDHIISKSGAELELRAIYKETYYNLKLNWLLKESFNQTLVNFVYTIHKILDGQQSMLDTYVNKATRGISNITLMNFEYEKEYDLVADLKYPNESKRVSKQFKYSHASESQSTKGLQMPDILPASMNGIRDLQVTAISNEPDYEITATFSAPLNIYNKNIIGYYYEIFQFSNIPHLEPEPFMTSTYIFKDMRTFNVKGMLYDTRYFLKVDVYYEGEATNFAYSGIKHLYYPKSQKENFTATDKFIYAPLFDKANVKKYENGSYEINVQWLPNVQYKDYNITRYDVRLCPTDLKDTFSRIIISHEANDLNYTFTSIPPNAEYQVAIYPDNHMKDETASRIFFNLFENSTNT